jgi:predicted transposase YbfD/YdcC
MGRAEVETLEQFASCWEGLEDPRSGNAGLHDFHELLVIALCTVLCGGQGAVDMALFAKAKESFLRGFLALENGPPSHDTFSRLFRNLDPDQFRAVRLIGPAASRPCTWSAHGAASSDWCWRRSPPMLNRTRSPQCPNRGPQRQVFVAGVETGVPSDRSSSLGWKLLALLTLKGTIVTADALNCQRSIAQQIVDQKGDYALALKGNQGTLHDDVVLLLDDPECAANTAAPVVEGDHGRIETRTATVSTEIGWLQKQHQWPGLKAIGKIVRVRQTAEQTTTETAYYLLSATLTPERFNEVVRQHWGVENRLHWRLDVVMNEDQDRTRLGNGPHNLAVLRHMVLNAIQKEGSKGSTRGKFKRAGWDDAFLTRLLEMF